jgi:hypothetical protein
MFPRFQTKPTYNFATNRFATLPAATPVYDANGQLTSDGFHTYEWNADGNLGQLDGGTGTQITNYYDALGRRVEQVPVSGSASQMVWDPLGWRRWTANGQTFTTASLILPGGSLAFYAGSSLNAIRHADWLGSMRFTTAANGTYLRQKGDRRILCLASDLNRKQILLPAGSFRGGRLAGRPRRDR